MKLDNAFSCLCEIKKFSSKIPDWRDLIECIDAARYAPMSGDNYSLKFILVKDKEKIQKISQSSQQPFLASAPYLIVVCTNPNRTKRLYENQAETCLKHQAGAAIENILLKIQEKKLSACWVRYFVEYMVKEILKIPEEVLIEAIIPVGYALDKSRTKKTKIDLDKILYFDEYGETHFKKIKKLEV